MKVRREKGFRRIEISDQNSEITKTYSNQNQKCLFFFVIIGVLLFIFIVFEICYLFYFNEDFPDNKNSSNFDSFKEDNQNIRNNNITSTTDLKISNEQNNFNKNMNDTEIYDNNIHDKNIHDNNMHDNIENITNNVKINKDKYYNKKYAEVNNPKISIITIVNDYMKDNIGRLFDSIYEQNFNDIEIIIFDDYINNNNSLIYDELKSNDKRVSIISDQKITGKLKKRIEGVNKSKGEYILFIDSDDYFSASNILEKIYNQAINDKIDILEFKSFHWIQCQDLTPIHQPKIFDLMYFGNDIFSQLRQFHISGKLIKKEFFINVLNNLDNLYKEQNMNYYEESMILFILLKKAESYELLRIQGTVKSCNYCDMNIGMGNEEINNNFLIYLKLMTQYSSDHVPEKRLLSYLFINNIINRNIYFTNKTSLNLLKDIFQFFLSSEKISDDEKDRIKEYQDKINKRNEDTSSNKK